MRKIVAYVATSIDGFIARPDGDVRWLDRPEPKGGYGMGAFDKTVDTVLLGRKTFDISRKLGQPVFPGKKGGLSEAASVGRPAQAFPSPYVGRDRVGGR